MSAEFEVHFKPHVSEDNLMHFTSTLAGRGVLTEINARQFRVLVYRSTKAAQTRATLSSWEKSGYLEWVELDAN